MTFSFIKSKVFLFSLLFCFLSVLFCVPASANSAPAFWEGRDSSGILLLGDSCPIEVKNEKLTLCVTDLPEPYQNGASYWESYSNDMTAEYTFFNPTKEAITAKLVFPCGSLPGYALQEAGNHADNTARYGAFADGQPIQTTVRYSFQDDLYEFNITSDVARLRDTISADAFLTPETPVTTYLFRLDGIDYSDDYGEAVLHLEGGAKGRYICVCETESNSVDICSDMEPCYTYVYDGFNLCAMTVFGPPLEEGSAWEFFDVDNKKIGSVPVPAGDSMTMTEFCQQAKSAYPDASDVDIFNAYADALHSGYFYNALLREDGSFIPELMRWYEYDLTLQPGKTKTNTVHAPLYPVIRGNKKPRLYDYTYLLSPAAEWADFGGLEVTIETPYYLTGANPEGFQKTEGGFSLQTEGLPDGELTFTVCESRLYYASDQSMVISILISLFFTGILLGVFRIVSAIGRRCRKIVPYHFSGEQKTSAGENGEAFRFEVKVTEQDYYEFNRFVSFRTVSGKRPILRLRLLIAVTCILSLFASYTNNASANTVTDLTLLVSVAIPLMILPQVLLKPLLLWSLKLRLKRLRKHDRILYTPEAVIKFDGLHFHEITPTTKSELDYSIIERICVVRNRILYLFKKNTAAYLIPWHAFSSQAELDALLTFLENRTGKTAEWFENNM